MTGHRELALEHLTLLQVSPADLVSLAAEAGFDAVSLRIAPASPGEDPWPMSPGSRMLAETVRRLMDTGVSVLGVEAIRLDAAAGPARWEATLESAARLDARYVSAMSDDHELSRLSDRFRELSGLARSFGIRPVIEFMAYKPVRTLSAAVQIASRSSGGGVLIDALHFQRCGADLQQLRHVDASLLTYVQLCDAPLNPPVGLPVPDKLPRHQPTEGGDLALEARTSRLLPGEGELPLVELLTAVPPGTPVAVEAPCLALSRELGPRQFALRARRALAQVLAAIPH